MKRGREEEEDFDENDIERFHEACKDGNVKEVQDFITRGINVNLKCTSKPTALHYAAVRGHVDVANVLIQNDADVNAVYKDKYTPLHCAARKGHVDVAKVLIQNGADVNAVDKYNETPLVHAGNKTALIFELLCLGAVIDERALFFDHGVLNEINDRMNLLRAGKRPL